MRFRPSLARRRQFATGMPVSLGTARFAFATRLPSASDRTVLPPAWSTTLATVLPRRRLTISLSSAAVDGGKGVRSIRLQGQQYPMRPMKLAEVRKNTDRRLTHAEAVKLT